MKKVVGERAEATSETSIQRPSLSTVSYTDIQAQLSAGHTVILDGGTGTELELRGASMDPEAWCGAATIENIDLLETIHRDYIDAGAQIITANTYASSRLMLEPAGLADRFGELNRAAVQAAHRAREASGSQGIAVAGSLSHMVPMVAGASTSDRSRNPSEDQLADAFGELATLHKDEGCDLIVLEMMFHPERMPHVMAAAKATGLPVWAGMSVREGNDGEPLSFTIEGDIPFNEIVELACAFQPDVCGVMHSPSHLVSPAIDIVKARFGGPLMAYPDSGYFAMPEWRFENIIPPAELHSYGSTWQSQGVQILGGCCGLSPRHIEALVPLSRSDQA